MIKLVYVLARRTDVAPADFHDYWLRAHGPRVRGHAAAIRARKYVQSHTVDTPANEALRAPRGMLPPVAGITEVWWDALADLTAAMADAEGAAALEDLARDEASFIDIAASQVFLTRENLIFDFRGGARLDPATLKCTYLLARRDGLGVEQCHRTWLRDHGPLVASTARTLDMTRYIQSHTLAPDLNAAMAASRGLAEPLDGITEVWSEPGHSFDADPDERRRAGEILVEDERRFVQMDRSRCFFTREHEIFDFT